MRYFPTADTMNIALLVAENEEELLERTSGLELKVTEINRRWVPTDTIYGHLTWLCLIMSFPVLVATVVFACLEFFCSDFNKSSSCLVRRVIQPLSV